jgi:hypothetical protein
VIDINRTIVRFAEITVVVLGVALSAAAPSYANSDEPAQSAAESPQAMQVRISRLEAEVSELKAIIHQLQPPSPPSNVPAEAAAEPQAVQEQRNVVQKADRKTLDFLHDTTINVALDTYYAYNFNHPVGRVNLLRAYDVLSNEISLSQASVVLERPPDAAAGRRWGARLDLQFGQATDTLQGNPANEPRPQIYRNIFQAYGTYIVPIGKGHQHRFRQVEQLAGYRRKLHQRPDQLLPILLVLLPPLLPHGSPGQYSDHGQVHGELLAGQRYEPGRGHQRFQGRVVRLHCKTHKEHHLDR